MNPDVLAMLWKTSLQTAIVAAVVWVICRLAPKAPASLRCALWLLVIVKLFVPPFAYLPAQLAFWQHPEPAMTQAVAMPDVYAPAPVSTPEVSVPVSHVSPVAPYAPPPAAEQPIATAAAPEPIDASEVLAFVWLAGVLSMAVLLAVRFSRQRRLVKGSTAASDELTATLSECAERVGVRRLPRIRLSRAAQTPMLVGAMRPVILLPEEILDSCGETHLRAMLLHELAHVKRRDMAILWLQQLAQALFFFHPAVWLAGREMRRERELACDELVLSRAGIAPKDYAAGYVSALKLANGRRAVATSLAMAEPFDLEKRRLQGILDRPIPKLSAPWLIVLLAMIAVALPTFVGCAKPHAVKAPPTQQDPKVMAGLTEVEGAGIVVTLHDSKKGPAKASPEVLSRYIVHDRDIREVVNELWGDGAKAISVNGQRLVANSAIRCVGPDVRVNSVVVLHPYTIKAVGDPKALAACLRLHGGPAEGLILLDMITVKQQSSVTVPAYGPALGAGEQDPKVMAGLTDVAGPGIVATLRDSPKRSADASPDIISQYTVHDRDIREVVNELHAAGAEAISVNDQRWVANSSVQFRGGGAYMNSVRISSPFVIKALGTPQTLNAALTLPGGPAEGLFLLDMIDIKQQPRVEVSAYRLATETRYSAAAAGASSHDAVVRRAAEQRYWNRVTAQDKMLTTFPKPMVWRGKGVELSLNGIGYTDRSLASVFIGPVGNTGHGPAKETEKRSLVLSVEFVDRTHKWSSASPRLAWAGGGSGLRQLAFPPPSLGQPAYSVRYYFHMPPKGTKVLAALSGTMELHKDRLEADTGPLGLKDARKTQALVNGKLVLKIADWRISDYPAHYASSHVSFDTSKDAAPEGSRYPSYLFVRLYSLPNRIPASGGGSIHIKLFAYDQAGRKAELDSSGGIWAGTGITSVPAEAYFGLSTPIYASNLNPRPEPKYKPVLRIDPEGPAAKAGIRVGDLVGSLDIWTVAPRPVTVIRNGKQLTVTIKPVHDPVWAGMGAGQPAPWASMIAEYTGGKVNQYGYQSYKSISPVPSSFHPVKLQFVVTHEYALVDAMPFKITNIPLPAGLWATLPTDASGPEATESAAHSAVAAGPSPQVKVLRVLRVLPNNRTISAFEPVIIEIQVTNTSSAPAGIYGSAVSDRLEVRDSTGKLVGATPVRSYSDLVSFSHSLGPGQSTRASFVPSAIYQFKNPGRYSVRIMLLSPPGFGNGEAKLGPAWAEATVPVTVTPFDAKHLEARCKELMESRRLRPMVFKYPTHADMVALWSVRNNAALPALKQVALTAGDSSYGWPTAEAIRRIGTPESATLLKALASRKDPMGRAARSALKAHRGEVDEYDYFTGWTNVNTPETTVNKFLYYYRNRQGKQAMMLFEPYFVRKHAAQLKGGSLLTGAAGKSVESILRDPKSKVLRSRTEGEFVIVDVGQETGGGEGQVGVVHFQLIGSGEWRLTDFPR